METSLDNGGDIIVYGSATEHRVYIISSQVYNLHNVHSSIFLPENKHQLCAYCHSSTDVTVRRESENLWNTRNTFIYLSKVESSRLSFFHQVRLGGGNPPIDSHLSEREEFSLADNLFSTLTPFWKYIFGFCGGTTTFRSIWWNVVCSKK